MGKAQPCDVLDEEVCQLRIAEQLIGAPGWTPPRAEVQLIDGHRRVEAHPGLSLSHPVAIAPPVGEVPYHRARARGHLAGEGERVGLVEALPPGRGHGVLVDVAPGRPRHYGVPDARGGTGRHRVCAGVPTVEVTDDRHTPRARRPHGEGHRRLPGGRDRREVGAQLLGQLPVRPLVEEIEVVVGELPRRRSAGWTLLSRRRACHGASVLPGVFCRCRRSETSVPRRARSTMRNIVEGAEGAGDARSSGQILAHRRRKFGSSAPVPGRL